MTLALFTDLLLDFLDLRGSGTPAWFAFGASLAALQGALQCEAVAPSKLTESVVSAVTKDACVVMGGVWETI